MRDFKNGSSWSGATFERLYRGPGAISRLDNLACPGRYLLGYSSSTR